MDILLINAPVFELPTAQRAGAIVYDGTSDLGLWRPPGPDRALRRAYGDDIEEVLARERSTLEGRRLEIAGAIRLPAGKLRCDFLIWVASRGSHGEVDPALAPALDGVEDAAAAALDVAARYGVVRVAFGALGAGPAAAPAHERMAAVVRGAHRFRKNRLDQGRAAGVDEVVICEPSAAEVSRAKRLVARLARQAAVVAPAASRKSPGTARPRGGNGKKRGAPGLEPAQVQHAKNNAHTYDRTRLYEEGEWFIHPSFGAGLVQSVLQPERMVTVLFEDGQQRKMIHGR